MKASTPMCSFPFESVACNNLKTVGKADPSFLQLLATLCHVLPMENTLRCNFLVMVNLFGAETTLAIIEHGSQPSPGDPARRRGGGGQVSVYAKDSKRTLFVGQGLDPSCEYHPAWAGQHTEHTTSPRTSLSCRSESSNKSL